MIKKFVFGLLVLSVGLLWAANVFVGTWKLNVGKSTFAKGFEVREYLATVVEQGDNQTVTSNFILGDGKSLSFKYTFPIKGGTIKYIEGAPAGLTGVATRIDANTLDLTMAVNGKHTEGVHCVMNPNGKTFTNTHTIVNQEGKILKSVEIYDRQ